GYALVHNAHLCRDVGYFYPGNDVEEGSNQLVHAIEHHNDDWQAYRARQRKAIRPFLSTHEPLIARYDELLFALVGDPGAGS
ncbi:DUF2827 family protein, partial [Burkholderia sp. SIMBA_057]